MQSTRIVSESDFAMSQFVSLYKLFIYLEIMRVCILQKVLPHPVHLNCICSCAFSECIHCALFIINVPEMKGFVIAKIFDSQFSLQNKSIEMTLLQLSRPDDNMWKCKHYCTDRQLNLATLIGFTYESQHTTLNNPNWYTSENVSRKTPT